MSCSCNLHWHVSTIFGNKIQLPLLKHSTQWVGTEAHGFLGVALALSIQWAVGMSWIFYRWGGGLQLMG